MRGSADAVLYVGKAKNLRHRLGSYRVANPERMARRTLRLLRLVERIAWEECNSERAALQRESELLLALKPRFNRAGVWQRPKRFLAWRPQSGGLELAVVESVEDGWHYAGPFGAQAKPVHRALVRLLWGRVHPETGLAGMPPRWFHGEHGMRVLISHHNDALISEACERLLPLANAGCDAFQQWLPPVTAPFEQPIRDEDVELVTRHLGARAVANKTVP